MTTQEDHVLESVQAHWAHRLQKQQFNFQSLKYSKIYRNNLATTLLGGENRMEINQIFDSFGLCTLKIFSALVNVKFIHK
jgi:hypothetical protein